MHAVRIEKLLGMGKYEETSNDSVYEVIDEKKGKCRLIFIDE